MASDDDARRTKAAIKIQSAFRGRKGRQEADNLRVQRQGDLNAKLIDDTNRKSGPFDIDRTFLNGASRPDLAGQTLFRRQDDASGTFTSYMQYDQHGGPIKRVDLSGATHGGIPTPHVLEFQRVNRVVPNKTIVQYSTPEKNIVRPAYPWELPHDHTSQTASQSSLSPMVDVRRSSNSAVYKSIAQHTPEEVTRFWTGQKKK